MQQEHLLNNQPNNIETRLIITAIGLFPLFYLTVRGWTNWFVFILLTISLFHFLKSPKDTSNSKNLGGLEWFMIGVFLSGFLAILISQVLRHQIILKPYDGPLRILLCAPIFLLLIKKRINFVQLFQYVCPLSLLILLTVVLSSPADMQGWGGRYSTYFVDPNSFGTYTMLLAFMCLFLVDIDGKDPPSIKLLKILGFLAGLYLEIKSQTRGAWIAEPFMLALWMGVHWRTKNKLALLYSVIVSAFIIFTGYLFIDFFHARINSIYYELHSWITHANTETSAGFRLSMWKISWALFIESPWFGYGDLGYQLKLLEPQYTSVYSNEVITIMQQVGPHNEFLANMVRSGIWGFIAVALQFFVPAIVFTKGLASNDQRIKGNCVIGICFILGLFITSLSIEVLTLKYTNSFYGLLIACLTASVLGKSAGQKS